MVAFTKAGVIKMINLPILTLDKVCICNVKNDSKKYNKYVAG